MGIVGQRTIITSPETEAQARILLMLANTIQREVKMCTADNKNHILHIDTRQMLQS